MSEVAKLLDYRDATQKFSMACRLAFEDFCRAVVPENKAHTAAAFTARITRHYERLVKPLFADDAEPVLQQEFGVVFGAFVGHLQALNAQWQVYSESNNALLDRKALSAECIEKASRLMRDSALKGSNVIAQLLAHEANMRVGAETLCALVMRDCERAQIVPGRSSLNSPVYQVNVMTQTRAKIYIACDYCSGTEYCYCPLSEVYDTAERRERLHKMAAEAFGGPVKFDERYEYILLERPKITH